MNHETEIVIRGVEQSSTTSLPPTPRTPIAIRPATMSNLSVTVLPVPVAKIAA